MSLFLRSIAIATLLALAGCASLPVPTETEGGMVAFPVEPINKAGGPFYYFTVFKVFEKGTDKQVDLFQVKPSAGVNVRTFGPLPAGDYYLGEMTTRVTDTPTMRFSYKPRPRTISIPFTVEEDTITMLPKKYWVFKRPGEEGGSSTSTEVLDLTDDVKALALEALNKQDKDSAWQIKLP